MNTVRLSANIKCDKTRKDHDLYSPIKFVGGNAENPGVFVDGRQMRVVKVCRDCRAEIVRVIDTVTAEETSYITPRKYAGMSTDPWYR